MIVTEANFEESFFKTRHNNSLKIYSFLLYKFPTVQH